MFDWIEGYKAAIYAVVIGVVIIIDRVISWMTGKR